MAIRYTHQNPAVSLALNEKTGHGILFSNFGGVPRFSLRPFEPGASATEIEIPERFGEWDTLDTRTRLAYATCFFAEVTPKDPDLAHTECGKPTSMKWHRPTAP